MQIMCFCTFEIALFPIVEHCDNYLVDPEEKLFFDSSAPADEVLLGIKDLPGDEFFLAGGGGVFRLFGTGDFSFKRVETVGFSLELLSSLRTGKFRSTGGGVDCSITKIECCRLLLGLGSSPRASP